MIHSVFVTRAVPGPAIDMLRESCKVDVWPGDTPPPRSIFLEKVRDVDGLLSLLTDTVDEEVFQAAGPKLKVVGNYAVGFDNIDIAAATKRRIPVGNTPGVLTETTADLAFALLMSAARRIVEGARIVDQGEWMSWSPTLLLGCDVHGATLGVLGMGRIGRAMARRGLGFDMKIVFHDPTQMESGAITGATSVSFEKLMRDSDFLSLHAPLNDSTRHIIDAEALGMMKPTAVLINTARGPVVDHDALFKSLAAGQIAYAALDVTEPEPLPADHPLHSLGNCLIVPHLGSASVATRSKMGIMAAENILAGLRAEPLPHCVNPEVYNI
jgi:glyoxylate reductase